MILSFGTHLRHDLFAVTSLMRNFSVSFSGEIYFTASAVFSTAMTMRQEVSLGRGTFLMARPFCLTAASHTSFVFFCREIDQVHPVDLHHPDT